jgi:hypothetical protein
MVVFPAPDRPVIQNTRPGNVQGFSSVTVRTNYDKEVTTYRFCTCSASSDALYGYPDGTLQIGETGTARILNAWVRAAA